MVSRSARHIFVQVVDDSIGQTVASASTMEADLRGFEGDKTAKAKVGELVAERAKAAGVDEVVFDRGGNKYHGRVAAIADGAREGGLSTPQVSLRSLLCGGPDRTCSCFEIGDEEHLMPGPQRRGTGAAAGGDCCPERARRALRSRRPSWRPRAPRGREEPVPGARRDHQPGS